MPFAFVESGRRRDRARAGLPGLPRRHRSWPAPSRTSVPLRAEHELPAELETHSGRGAPAHPAGVPQLSQQPDGRGRHARVPGAGGGASAGGHRSSWPTTTPTATSSSTATGRRASSRLPARTRWRVEFFSLSKSFSMTGWRIGFAVGRPEADRAADPGQVVQRHRAVPGGAGGGGGGARPGRGARRADLRRDLAAGATPGSPALRAARVPVETPKAAMYLWVALPAGVSSTAFARHALEAGGRRGAAGERVRPGG